MLVIAKTSTYQNPTFFRRSDTTVTNNLVTIGEREFSMRDILGAQVFDITAGNYLVDDAFKKKATVISRWISGVGALGMLGSFLLDSSIFP
ncbi:MAG: hypothetical protein ABIQ44_04965, partial [Chloroflexia bacterium]